jgi:ABC-type transporter Mla maintaining outer membrane lipid asymmetry ATPase subunit MlaF
MDTVQQILDEPGAPVVLFDRVQLAFDEKVVLQDVSFTLVKGHTKIILGASGSGKSTILKIIVGLLRSDARPSGSTAKGARRSIERTRVEWRSAVTSG